MAPRPASPTPAGASASISIFLEIWIDLGLRPAHDGRMELEKNASRLEALGNPTRLKVYRALVRAGDAGLPVGKLQQRLDLAASTLSHHLHRLILTGLVSQEREGTTLRCRANYPAMRRLIGFLSDECCADAGCVSEPAKDAA